MLLMFFTSFEVFYFFSKHKNVTKYVGNPCQGAPFTRNLQAHRNGWSQ